MLLKVENLITEFTTEGGPLRAVDQVSFAVAPGRTLGLVGESGCGKSVTALSVMRLLPKPAGRIAGGRILLDGLDLAALPKQKMPAIRGRRIAMIFQEPMTSLNPVQRIGDQLAEVFHLHRPEALAGGVGAACTDLLARVGIPEPHQRLNEYPHMISGGMRQRVMIAMALAGRPELLIADEPTTALDVTIQAQILRLIADLQRQTGMAVIFITHALGVVAQVCDEVAVMYAGQIAETAPVAELFNRPRHPYTMGLLGAIPRLDTPRKTRLKTIRGMVPSLADVPNGCRFANRCPYAMPICGIQTPPLRHVGNTQAAACWLYR
jgi:oligopeptide/dipeptide ABC transporter ATP-binding protein